ncbi:hypothetical protein BDW02DRAFT_566271 [Decorospora gaudefroyi]|uniref:DUF7730 domain-containing protein n=1 Tax=Decorospora gaudefroyi TaxID=184978 RepID=A0A6A5KJ81_9PLEO|nr:hypothetical protein BDW02DRAFT_566271 [Decorospora gaudefroyi]
MHISNYITADNNGANSPWKQLRDTQLHRQFNNNSNERNDEQKTYHTSTKSGSGSSKRRTTQSDAPELNTPRHQDQAIFPFLKLPAEIRNMIYRYTLVDDEYSVSLEAGTNEWDGRCIVRRLYRCHSGPPDRDDLSNVRRPSLRKASSSFTHLKRFRQFDLGVKLLQTCRQVNREATRIFYGMNMFVFPSVQHLYAFPQHFMRRLSLVRKIGLANAHSNSPCRIIDRQVVENGDLHAMFPLIMHATNLEALYMNTSTYQSLSKKRCAAIRLNQKAHVWLQAMVDRAHNPLAIIKLSKLATKKVVTGRPQWSTGKRAQDKFLATLAATLKMPVQGGA